MFSDSARQPLYLRSSNAAQASDDDAFWRTLQEKMASLNESMIPANDHQQDGEHSHALPVFADLAGGDKSDETLLRQPQKPPAARRQGGASWLLGFASLDDTFALAKRGEGGDQSTLPGLVRVPSSDWERDSDDSESDSDDSERDSDDSESDSDGDSVFSPPPSPKPTKKGVSFSSMVEVRAIPHSSSLSSSQRRRIYSSSSEIRRNKMRNEKEFCYDGYDWRNATEEQDMGVCQVTGELVHPAHDHELSF